MRIGGEGGRRGGSAADLRAVEAFWQVSLPDAFRHLYIEFDQPFLAPCEFLSLRDIAAGEGRMFGLLPQFLAFGRAVGEGGAYGFYISTDAAPGQWPVCYWDEDEEFLRPVASGFEAFLQNCVLASRYETEDLWPQEATNEHEIAERKEFARRLNLDQDLVLGVVPRNDTELHERLVAIDPQDAVSLCFLGCSRRQYGDPERALDFFHRAIEATPWFGDAPYLAADVYRERENWARATEYWWHVVQRLLPFCTRTWMWNLGADHPEADIYEVAADALSQHADTADPELRSRPLWRVVTEDDPYDPDVRKSLGDTLLSLNDLAGAEREYLNALSLCRSDRGRQPDRLYNALIGIYEKQGRRREAALARHDRSLQRD